MTLSFYIGISYCVLDKNILNLDRFKNNDTQQELGFVSHFACHDKVTLAILSR